MTIEEAIKQLKKCKSIHNGSYGEALEVAIKALSSWDKYSDELWKKAYARGYNDVLDKIRAEIGLNAYPIVHGVNNHEKGMTLYGILQVIDKYKVESEDKE